MIRVLLPIVFLFVSVHAGGHKPESTGSNNLTAIPGGTFYQFGDYYYYFQTSLKSTYYQAFMFCNAYGFDLLSIETAEENQFIYETLPHLLGKGQYNIWTSGTSLVSDEHTFYWLSTGQKVGYSNWEVNQPDDAGHNEKCLEVVYNKKEFSTLVWNDNVCTAENYFICELNSNLCANELDPNCPATNVITD